MLNGVAGHLEKHQGTEAGCAAKPGAVGVLMGGGARGCIVNGLDVPTAGPASRLGVHCTRVTQWLLPDGPEQAASAGNC